MAIGIVYLSGSMDGLLHTKYEITKAHLPLQYDLKDSRAAGSRSSFIERITSLPSETKAFLSMLV